MRRDRRPATKFGFALLAAALLVPLTAAPVMGQAPALTRATIPTPEQAARGSRRPLVVVGRAQAPAYVIPVSQRRLFDKVQRAVANGHPAKVPTPALAMRAAGRIDIVSAPALYVLPANLRLDRARKGIAVPTTTAARVPTPAQLAPGLDPTRRTP